MSTHYEPLEHVPSHIGFIMDGNGRWAQSRGLPRVAGHRAGTENIRRVLEASVEFGIKVMTLYAFSTENWGRPADEVKGLMRIFSEVIDREALSLNEKGVQIRHIGSLEGISEGLQEKTRRAMELTKDNDRLILNVALNYGGRAEIVSAVRKIISNSLPADQVTEEALSRHLYTAGLPDPDLIIRTAGEMRLSNFLIWQAAYAEYYSTSVYWPDFDKDELYNALLAFNRRERRYGQIRQR